MNTRIAYSNILKCFDDECVGTKVMNEKNFIWHLEESLDGRPNTLKEPVVFNEHGQAFVNMDVPAWCCSPGVIPRANLKKEDYILREWRGEMGIYAKRASDLATTALALVYTLEAYLADPEVNELEKYNLKLHAPEGGYSHVLVAVMASLGAPTALSSSRLVRNLAGGNNAFIPKTVKNFIDSVKKLTVDGGEIKDIDHDLQLLHKVIDEAKKTVEFEKNWVTVAD